MHPHPGVCLAWAAIRVEGAFSLRAWAFHSAQDPRGAASPEGCNQAAAAKGVLVKAGCRLVAEAVKVALLRVACRLAAGAARAVWLCPAAFPGLAEA